MTFDAQKLNKVSVLILEALGENPRGVVAMTIRFRVDEIPTITLERHALFNVDGQAMAASAFEHYELTKKE